MCGLALAIAMHFAVGADPFAGLDADLAKEITAWKDGTPPPARLLRLPDGRLPQPAPLHCDLRAWGDSVDDYISKITNVELLKALVFDNRADPPCFRAAVRRMLEISGVKGVRAILAARRSTHAADFDSRPELATLAQLLASPYVRVKVAFLDRNDVPADAAEQSLRGLEADLTAGVPWQRAYAKAANQVLDKERSRKEGGGWRTFLCYQYDGLVSPTGFDPLTYRISDRLKPDHIRRLFEAKGGTRRFVTPTGFWLYHTEAYYE
jgi:hypothetical protein